MTGNADGLRSLAKFSTLDIDRIDYRADADAGVIGSIDRGVLFLMAFWSVPSVTAFKKLTEVVARLDAEARLQLLVVDVGGAPARYEVPEFLGKVHGAGETAWIRGGKIVATSGLGWNTVCQTGCLGLQIVRFQTTYSIFPIDIVGVTGSSPVPPTVYKLDHH